MAATSPDPKPPTRCRHCGGAIYLAESGFWKHRGSDEDCSYYVCENGTMHAACAEPEPSPPAEAPSEEPLEAVVARVRRGSRNAVPVAWAGVGFTPADLHRLLEAAEENERLGCLLLRYRLTHAAECMELGGGPLAGCDERCPLCIEMDAPLCIEMDALTKKETPRG